VSRKLLSWVGPLALGILVSFGVAPTEGAARKAPRAARKTAYSAVRSQTRKAKLAHARVAAMAREMAETVLPR